MATTSTSTTKKPILIIKSPEYPSKSSSRNVRFVPEITADDDQTTVPIQDPLTSQSTANQIQQHSLSATTTATSNRKIKTNRRNHKKTISTPRAKNSIAK
ncbi:unnamed protein product [Rotaria magnacalcarata]|uniref:Uncharacterized protein n=1 Tax=Rotaria magnacalcarata TaxID=392030 RepID=A0A815N0I5_9BILA|nr:unnamed protein product [Rotaria magnacalcarata]CAF1428435.1 unnamed protein product [Rotaria magnacalcarata]CAF2118584.1 unnamed protein product [Rotaria magnacalcarata]CAF3952389.1 unnamed protein product [Rotaria magnacalcarata]CAF3966736.1 unnamed protein product [Rotaria magnacalcarata]